MPLLDNAFSRTALITAHGETEDPVMMNQSGRRVEQAERTWCPATVHRGSRHMQVKEHRSSKKHLLTETDAPHIDYREVDYSGDSAKLIITTAVIESRAITESCLIL